MNFALLKIASVLATVYVYSSEPDHNVMSTLSHDLTNTETPTVTIHLIEDGVGWLNRFGGLSIFISELVLVI